jgi:hypothetical protein
MYLPGIFQITMKTERHTIAMKEEYMCLRGFVKTVVSTNAPSSPFPVTPTAANLVDEYVYKRTTRASPTSNGAHYALKLLVV